MDSHDHRTTEATAVDLDLRRYLDRIHVSMAIDTGSSQPSLWALQALHEAHMLTVPFENLSIHFGQPIVLREAALYEKVVVRRRGGFCYELNGMFAWLLRHLGYDVTLLSAGVAQAGEAYTPEYDHMALLVRQVDGDDWLVDVGFGDSFRRPLRLQADVEQDGADGRLYRLREDHIQSDAHDERQYPYWVVEGHNESGWDPQYRFTLQPHALTDFTERCQYQQTSPESHFTQKRICSLALPRGRVSLSDLRLITTIDGKRDERMLESEEEYHRVLEERFGVVV